MTMPWPSYWPVGLAGVAILSLTASSVALPGPSAPTLHPAHRATGHSPGVRLLGVSTIGGNQTLAKVTHNALDVLDAIGLTAIS